MSIPVNLNATEAWSVGDVLPPGTYVCKIEEAIEGESRNRHPQIELKLSCSTGSIRDWIVITPATLGKVKQLLEAAGVAIPSGDFNLDANSLINRSVQIIVREKPDNEGKPRARVIGYESAKGAAAGGPMGAPAADTSGFGSQAAGVGAADDDLPF